MIFLSSLHEECESVFQGDARLGGETGGLGGLLELSVVAVVGVQLDAILHRLQRRVGRTHLGGGCLNRHRLGLQFRIHFISLIPLLFKSILNLLSMSIDLPS